MKAQMQKGFTLIELMIVVAIIGILAAIAIPAYSNYQAKSKATAGLAEISAMKTLIEEAINSGEMPDGSAVTAANLTTAFITNANTANCTLAIDGDPAADLDVSCTILKAPPQVNGAVMTWTRDGTNGSWTCATTGAADGDLAPKSCPQA